MFFYSRFSYILFNIHLAVKQIHFELNREPKENGMEDEIISKLCIRNGPTLARKNRRMVMGTIGTIFY